MIVNVRIPHIRALCAILRVLAKVTVHAEDSQVR